MSDRLARLMIQVQGSDATAELPRSGALLVGSNPSKVGLHIEGQGVASVHCAIARAKGGGWALKDLGSEFGVQVNGRTVKSQRLALGDVILIGSRRLTIVDPAAGVEEPVPAAQPPQPGAPDPEPTPPRGPAPAGNGARPSGLPEVLGGYRILRSLGQGGTGRVFLALQESLHRQVALKVLDRRHQADRVFVGRFQEEARAAAALSHPNVVTVYDVGEDVGHHYLSMEYMAGGDLEGWIAREGPLPWRTLLDVLRDAASGLVFAESKGIVHRDLKPANLMRDDHGVVKIADLGLATQVEAKETSSEGRRLFGTPHFIAPEIVRGERPDARSDLYSLGATAYRLLTGHTPFEGSSATEILRGALHGSFPPVGERVPDVPRGLCLLIERLLERDPSRRPPTAQTLLDSVDGLRRGEGLHPDPGQAAAPAAGIGRPVLRATLAIGALTAIFIGGRRFGLWAGDGQEGLAGGNPVAGAGTGEDPTPDGPMGPGLAAGPGGPVPAAGSQAEAGTGDPSDPAGGTEPDPVDSEPQPGDLADDGTPPEPVDDDRTLKLLEEEARLAFLSLVDSSMSTPERVLELRTLAERFAGTSAAAAGLARARELENSVDAGSTAASEAALLIDGAVDLLRRVAGLDAVPPTPASSLAALAALETTGQFPPGDAFLARRNALVSQIVDRAIAHGREQGRLADEAAVAGDYARRRILLEEYLATADLPTPETWPAATPTPGPTASHLARLEAVATSARLSLLRVDYDESVFRYERERRDALVLAVALARPVGEHADLQAELRVLDLAQAAERFEQVATLLEDPELKQRISQRAVDLTGASGSFAILAGEYLAEGWRRKTVIDPRTGGRRASVTRETVGADGAGVRVRMPGGTIESIPWSAFGGQTRALENLFHDRLRRNWTARERHDIANLVTTCAVAEALAGAGEMLRPATRAHFTAGEARAMRAAFDHPGDWATTTESRLALERETAATEVLVDVLTSIEDGAFARAVAGTERLLAEYGDTLLALAFSDGSEWRDPVPDPRFLPPPELPGLEPIAQQEPGASPQEPSTEEDG